MERLTKKNDYNRIGGYIVTTETVGRMWSANGTIQGGDHIDRLAYIEDILGDDYDLERLKELVGLVKNIPHVCKFCVGCEMEPKDGHGCDEYDSFVFSTRRLQELAEADREGRCVVLPCKVGDVLYSAFPLCGVNKHQVRKFERNSEGDFACSALMIPISDFGKRVFLTREEAEAALKGERDG